MQCHGKMIASRCVLSHCADSRLGATVIAVTGANRCRCEEWEVGGLKRKEKWDKMCMCQTMVQVTVEKSKVFLG